MKHPSIASIISFCSLDARFLPYAIEALRPFSDQIFISVCSYRFDGKKENNQIYFDQVFDCTFIESAFSSSRLYGTDRMLDPSDPLYKHHWHNTLRLVPTYFLDEQIEWVLFLDADEILDTQRFMEMSWEEGVYRLASYWYFREPTLQATTWLDSAVFMPKKFATPDVLLHPKERTGILHALGGKNMILGSDAQPLVHHYSWVRTKQEMLEKVQCWAHGYEANWEALIEQEMCGSFSGTDFVYGFDYKTVTPFIDPFNPKSYSDGQPSKVYRVNPKDVYNLEVKRCFLTPTPT